MDGNTRREKRWSIQHSPSLKALGTKVYFAHPYSSWERPQNERHNGLLREFIPKGTSIEQYTDDDILTEIPSRTSIEAKVNPSIRIIPFSIASSLAS